MFLLEENLFSSLALSNRPDPDDGKTKEDDETTTTGE